MSLHHQFINGKTADRRIGTYWPSSEGKQAGGFCARSTVGSLEAGDAVVNIISETQATLCRIVSVVFDYAVCVHSLELIARCSNGALSGRYVEIVRTNSLEPTTGSSVQLSSRR
jgi:hypothetical protein